MISKQQIKYIRSLHQKKYRDECNCFIAEGKKIINEAIESSLYEIEIIVHTPRSNNQLNLKSLKGNTKIIEVSSKEFSRISAQKSPQEVLAVFKMNRRNTSITRVKEGLIIALDRIRDPGNLGTIMRLADWFGVKDILCSGDCVDVHNPKVIQSSMGAFLRVNLIYGKLGEILFSLKKKHDYSILGTTLTGRSIYKESFSDKTIVVLGNESNGISEEIASLMDGQITIPNYSANIEKTESLNVSVAAAIICSEIRRRE